MTQAPLGLSTALLLGSLLFTPTARAGLFAENPQAPPTRESCELLFKRPPPLEMDSVRVVADGRFEDWKRKQIFGEGVDFSKYRDAQNIEMLVGREFVYYGHPDRMKISFISRMDPRIQPLLRKMLAQQSTPENHDFEQNLLVFVLKDGSVVSDMAKGAPDSVPFEVLKKSVTELLKKTAPEDVILTFDFHTHPGYLRHGMDSLSGSDVIYLREQSLRLKALGFNAPIIGGAVSGRWADIELMFLSSVPLPDPAAKYREFNKFF